jgi:hypothetical protein
MLDNRAAPIVPAQRPNDQSNLFLRRHMRVAARHRPTCTVRSANAEDKCLFFLLDLLSRRA